MRTPLLVASALALVLLGTGCGGDDAPADATDRPGAAATDGGLDTSVLDEVPADRVTQALGEALVSVLPDASAFSFDGERLVVEMTAGRETAESTCAIAATARDGIGASVGITLSFDGDEVVCG